MSEHKGLPVAGYRAQGSAAVNRVNANKELEERVLRAIDEHLASGYTDKRWVAIAKIDIEKGFMALNRSVFQPARVALPEDQAL